MDRQAPAQPNDLGAALRGTAIVDLSVSCIGSNGLKPDRPAGRSHCAGDFQYPVSDRMG